MEEILETLKNADSEGTHAPYWLIIDPHQMMSPDVHDVASMIAGPFFCRRDAEEYLNIKRYNFSEKARVYCHSGHYSRKYEALFRREEI